MAIKTMTVNINGQVTNLIYNATSGYYEGSTTAPSKSSYPLDGHYYPVTVKATDEAGNVTSIDNTDGTLGNKLRLVVKEKNAPTLSFISPGAGAFVKTNKPTITWKVTDDDSGVNPDTIAITVDGTKVTTDITKTAIAGGYQCSYVPTLSDGSHTIKIDATDFDGNAGVQKTVAFKVDTTPPALNITSPNEGLITNNANITVKGTTNDVTSSPVTVKVNGTAVSVSSTGEISYPMKLATEGKNVLEITATDSAGQTSKVTRTVYLDTKAPVIQEVILTPSTVDGGATFTIKVKASDD